MFWEYWEFLPYILTSRFYSIAPKSIWVILYCIFLFACIIVSYLTTHKSQILSIWTLAVKPQKWQTQSWFWSCAQVVFCPPGFRCLCFHPQWRSLTWDPVHKTLGTKAIYHRKHILECSTRKCLHVYHYTMSTSVWFSSVTGTSPPGNQEMHTISVSMSKFTVLFQVFFRLALGAVAKWPPSAVW